ncbi:MAG: ATP-binding protein [Burkholderiales bacterium]
MDSRHFSLTRPLAASPVAAILISLALVLLIGLADLITGYEFTLSILYLIPIFLTTWTVGQKAGVWIAIAASVASFFADLLAGHEFSHRFYQYWDALIALGTFIIFGAMLSRLKLALARSDERLVTVLERLDAAVCVLDPEHGTLLFANERFKRDFAGTLALGVAERLRWLLTINRPASGGEGVPGSSSGWSEVDGFEENHAGRWYLIRTRPIRWVDGRSVALLTATDITESKRAEQINRQQRERLEATAKLVAVGEMASMLAHQINQPLAAVINYNGSCVRRLKSGTWDPETLIEIMEQASREATRAGTIIQRVREFVRKRAPSRAPTEINAMVEDTLSLMRGEADKHNVNLAFEPAPGLPPVNADRVMLEQVIINLLKNGIEAMNDTPAGQRELRVLTGLNDVRSVRISVCDRGHGIPAGFADNLFQPFFTTKREGMGLGLSICRSVVEFHGGMLWATPNPDGGSSFHFTLPMAGAPA